MKNILLTFIAAALLFTTGNLSFAETKSFPSITKYNLCTQKTRASRDPSVRDRNRFQCLKQFSTKLSLEACIKVAGGFEYSINSESAMSHCLFESQKKITPQICSTAALKMAYGENRDELVWGCLRKLNPTIKVSECKALTRLMVFPRQKDRAFIYCENEIAAAQ